MPRTLKILIVEDSPAMRQLLALAVRKRAGVEVQEAADGLAALKLLANAQFDLVFVDLNMPILDGMKLIKKIRESETTTGTPRVRICVVTTESAQATEDQARALGADFFVRKPVARRDVERILAEAFPA
jgi:two-component system, chemotaxis family, chemotaxis protein CheY